MPYGDVQFGRQRDLEGDIRILEVRVIQSIQVSLINALGEKKVITISGNNYMT